MDHEFIDKFAIADRYVRRTLPSAERAEFEAHLVDCQECPDRVLLAEMLRNGGVTPIPVGTPQIEPLPGSRRTKHPNVSSASLWKVALLFAVAAALLLAVPTSFFLWKLHHLR